MNSKEILEALSQFINKVDEKNSDVEFKIEFQYEDDADIFYGCNGISIESGTLDDFLNEENSDETTSKMLMRLIDEKGISDANCYKRAQLSRGVFNKIKNNEEYYPRKKTLFALGLALELSLEEMEEFLESAGYAFTSTNKMDLIIKFAITNKIYNIAAVNELLFEYKQELLGSMTR